MTTMRHKKPGLTRKLVSAAAALLFSVAVQAQVRTFDIPAGELKTVLDAYVAQTGQQLVYRSDDLKGLRSKGVQASLTTEQALERLLDGTQLRLRRDASGAFVIFLAEVAAGGASTVIAASASIASPDIQVIIVTGSPLSHLAQRSRTGTRSDIDPLALPQSVSTVDKGLLEQQQVRDIRDALANVAGASGAGQEDGLVTMRGFPAGIMRNGNISAGNGGSATFNSPLITVAKIEVVKGPEAIIAGLPSGYGGVVNVITKAPQVAPVRDLVLSLGSRGYHEVGLDLGNPLVEDKSLLGRLVLSKSGEGSDLAGYDGNRRDYLAPSLSWNNRSSGTGVSLSYEYQRGHVKPTLAVFFAPNKPFDSGVSPARLLPAGSGTDEKQHIASLLVNQRIAPGWDIGFKLSSDRKDSTQLVGFSGTRPALGFPYPNILTVANVFDSSNSTKTAKLELKGYLETGSIEHTLLLAYDHIRSRSVSGQESKFVSATDLGSGVTTDVTDKLGPRFGVPAPREESRTEPVEKGLLIYNHMAWGPLVGLVGWRQIGFEQGDPLNPDQAAFKQGLPSVGVVYRVTPTLSLYASGSKGFQPNIGITTADGAPLPPESSQQSELGFKALLADKQIALTGAIFQIKQRNVATPDFDNSPPEALYWLSVPGVTAKGAELEMSGNLTKRFSLRTSYAYLDKKADTPDAIGIVYVKNQASLWGSYRLGEQTDAGWWLGAGLQWRSGALGFPNPDVVPSPAQWRVDVNGGYQAKQWSVVAGVKNLADKRQYSLNSRGDSRGFLLQPREFYATARYSF